jgi:hypothetical protein
VANVRKTATFLARIGQWSNGFVGGWTALPAKTSTPCECWQRGGTPSSDSIPAPSPNSLAAAKR